MPLPYRLAGTGSRTWPDTEEGRDIVWRAFNGWIRPGAEFFVGDAEGADAVMAWTWAQQMGRTSLTVIQARFHDKGLKGYAGNIRNDLVISRMPSILLAFVHNPYESPGTMDCIARARKAGIFTVIHYWPHPEGESK